MRVQNFVMFITMDTANAFNPFSNYLDISRVLEENQRNNRRKAEDDMKLNRCVTATRNTNSLALPVRPRFQSFNSLTTDMTRSQTEWHQEPSWTELPSIKDSNTSHGNAIMNSEQRDKMTIKKPIAVGRKFAEISKTPWTSHAVENLCELMAAQSLVHSQPLVDRNGNAPDLNFYENCSPVSLRLTNMEIEKDRFCNFCRTNGETPLFYKSHDLKDKFGRVLCPVLRSFRCPICNSTGDNAHTVTYCPFGSGRASAMTASWTRRKSCGCLKDHKKRCHHHNV